MAEDLVARLDKRAEHVLCGSVPCGARLARILAALDEGQQQRYHRLRPGMGATQERWRLGPYYLREEAEGRRL